MHDGPEPGTRPVCRFLKVPGQKYAAGFGNPRNHQAMNPRLKILFVCAMNKRRSSTAERIFRNDARLEIRSAGVRSEANRRVNEADLRWADVVFVMERQHKVWIDMRFQGVELPRIDVLDIPDDFEYMDMELQEMLGMLLGPEIDHLLASRDRSA